MSANITLESNEISILLDACSEMIDSISLRALSVEKDALKRIVGKIRDNGEVSTDLREYAKEILEG